MTCCTGWSIRVDQENMDKWKNNPDTAYLCDYTVSQEKNDEVCHSMKLNAKKTCVLLDQCGLCEIVKKHGEQFLSKTCAEFPRKCNPVVDIADEAEKVLLEEYSMSGACPEVVRLIFERGNQSVVALPDYCRDKQEFPMEYRIRNMVITLLQDTDYSVEEKIALCFSFLHECLECEWEDDVYNCIEVYSDEENQEEAIALFETANCNEQDAFMELCQTFFDITEFYRLEPMYQPYLKKICDFVASMDEEGNFAFQNDAASIEISLEDMTSKWNQFKEDFQFYDEKMINVMCSEIFADCISDDLEILIESFQSIVMEYLMIRVSLFYQCIVSDCGDYREAVRSEWFEQNMILLTSLYIRMIGHNVDGMAEYWEENFESPVLEMDYLYLLLQ